MKHMKSVLAVLLAMTLMLAGCGRPSTSDQQAAPDVAALADDMKSASTLDDEFINVDSDILGNLYEYDAESISAFSVYTSATMSTPEEIAVFVAADAESVNYIEEMIDYRLQTLRFSYEDYAPLEMPKIENAKVLTNGLYVTLIICEDPAPAQDVFEKAFS